MTDSTDGARLYELGMQRVLDEKAREIGKLLLLFGRVYTLDVTFGDTTGYLVPPVELVGRAFDNAAFVKTAPPGGWHEVTELGQTRVTGNVVTFAAVDAARTEIARRLNAAGLTGISALLTYDREAEGEGCDFQTVVPLKDGAGEGCRCPVRCEHSDVQPA